MECIVPSPSIPSGRAWVHRVSEARCILCMMRASGCLRSILGEQTMATTRYTLSPYHFRVALDHDCWRTASCLTSTSFDSIDWQPRIEKISFPLMSEKQLNSDASMPWLSTGSVMSFHHVDLMLIDGSRVSRFPTVS